MHYADEMSYEKESGEREGGCYTKPEELLFPPMKRHLSKTMRAWGHKLGAISDGGEINQN